ncbi:MAG TPA: histidine kinase [bacterium]
MNTRNHRSLWAAIFSFWALIAILYTSQNILSRLIQGGAIDWGRTMSWSLTRWFIWAGLTPLVFALARRFPIERARLKRGLLQHLGLGSLVALLNVVLEVALLYIIWRLAGETIPTLERFISLFTYSFHINLLIYWAIVGAHYAFEYHQKYRERELATSRLQSQLSQAQLQALKAQIHPHFLFNTHHAILGLMLKKQNDAAMQMLTSLSDLLRLTLENAGLQEISLKQELEFVELYLNIQKTRFHDRLSVKMDVAAETLSAQVPNLILQPLVENSIEHGIVPHSAAGQLQVTAKREDGKLIITVRDDGPGLSTQQPIKEGIGLKNTRARLQQMYGASHRFELISGKSGLLVSIEIPFQSIDKE